MTNEMQLGQIPAIKMRIEQYSEQYVQVLHTFIYERPIVPEEPWRNNLKEFKGFINPQDKEYCTWLIDKKFKCSNFFNLNNSDLRDCCKILGIKRDGSRSDLMSRLVESLMNINKLAFTPDNHVTKEKNINKLAFTPDNHVTKEKNINVESIIQSNTQENADASKVKKRRYFNSDTSSLPIQPKASTSSEKQVNFNQNETFSSKMAVAHKDYSSPPMQPKASTSSEKQVNFNQNETFSIKMAVAHKDYPAILLTQEKTKEIEGKIEIMVDNEPENNESLQFHGSCFEHGVLMVTCANENTKKWLIQIIREKDFCELKVVDSKNLQKKYRLRLRIQGIWREETIRSKLNKHNHEISHLIDKWKIQSTTEREGETLVYCEMDYASFSFLEKKNFEVYWRFGKITLQTIEDNKNP